MKSRRRNRSPFRPGHQYVIYHDGFVLVADGRDISVTNFGMLHVKKSWNVEMFEYTGKKSKLNGVARKHNVGAMYKSGEVDHEIFVSPQFIKGREKLVHEDDYEAEEALDKLLNEVAGVDTSRGTSIISQMMCVMSFYERMTERQMVLDMTKKELEESR